MDLEGHYPKNTISHRISSNETQITLQFFSGPNFCYIRDIMVISKTGLFLLTSSSLNVLLFWVPAGWPTFEKVGFSTFFLKKT